MADARKFDLLSSNDKVSAQSDFKVYDYIVAYVLQHVAEYLGNDMVPDDCTTYRKGRRGN